MSHNPYTPPTSQLDGVVEKTAFDFSSTADYSFTPKQLWWAGACCVFGVVLAIPYFATIFMESTPALEFASMATLFVLVALSIYVYLIFKKLLTEKSGYRAANLGISLYILASILAALTAPFTNNTEASLTTTVVTVIELMVSGSITIYIGIQLLRCEDPLFGQGKRVAYLTLATGITMTSVILAPIGVFVSFALEIAMAIMFFRASHALAEVQS